VVDILGADFANVGTYTSITTDGYGLGLISYFDETNRDLKLAHCADAACVTR